MTPLKRMIKTFYREYLIILICAVSINVLSADLRTRIAVFDTGIRVDKKTKPWICETGSYDATGFGIHDVHGHGTNIAGLITNKLDVKKYCLVIIKYYHDGEINSKYSLGITYKRAWEKLAESNASFVNMSLSGIDYYLEEYRTIRNLLDNGVKVIVAAGNERLDFSYMPCTRYPACYNMKSNNYYVVGAKDGLFSNFNGPVKYYDFGYEQTGFGLTMSGTSQATANFTNKLVRGIEK